MTSQANDVREVMIDQSAAYMKRGESVDFVDVWRRKRGIVKDRARLNVSRAGPGECAMERTIQ